MTHPFHAIAALATEWDGLRLIEEREGRYIRLHYRPLDLLFIRRADPGDSIDRIRFGFSHMVLISEDQLAQGPQAMLQHLIDEARQEADRQAEAMARMTRAKQAKP